MRRFMVLVTMVLVMAAMLVLAGPASAQAGCQDFGLFIAAMAPHGEAASGAAPLNNEVVFLKELNNC